MRSLERPTFHLSVLIAAWVLAIGAGFFIVYRYKSTPGPSGATTSRWPVESRIGRSTGRPRLLAFLHPRCPCSRATLHELERILDRAPVPVAASVIFVEPDGAPSDWETTELVAAARALRSVDVGFDPGGVDARRFGAGTSGVILLYSADGALEFKGGVTSLRGHEGDSPGGDRLLALLRGQQPEQHIAPVFGCSLEAPSPTR